MFQAFPKTVNSAHDWLWDEYEPYVQNLLSREVTPDSIDGWLTDWTAFNDLVWEVISRANVATTVDTTDEAAEQRYKTLMQQVYPKMLEANYALGKKLVESGVTPDNYEVPMRGIQAQIELFHPKNLPLLSQESELGTQYNKIIGAQTIEWEGEEITLRKLAPVYAQRDRDKRETAFRLAMQRQLQDRDALNDLWVQLMNLRKDLYQNLGLANYREYAWKQRGRFDYTPENALEFCAAIKEVVVPAAQRQNEQRRQQLGYDALRPWDGDVDPLGRDPMKPYATINEFEMRTSSIFNRLNPELGQYFHTMMEEGLLDLENRKGKAPGGYCTSFPISKRPFIFMNAVGLDSDIRVLLHEAGHAFHAFEAFKLPYTHQRRAPMEFNEVASMAMELLAMPYIKNNYGGYYDEADYARSRIDHLQRIVKFWPYMAVVVAFQHWVYTNHDTATDPAACDAKWTEIWHEYMTGIDYSGLDDWVATGWQRKLHIFRVPFYYIEYGIAQLGAVQVWANALRNQEMALYQYQQALALGGTATLPQLYETAGARLAFDAETLGQAVALIEKTVAELEETPAQ